VKITIAEASCAMWSDSPCRWVGGKR